MKVRFWSSVVTIAAVVMMASCGTGTGGQGKVDATGPSPDGQSEKDKLAPDLASADLGTDLAGSDVGQEPLVSTPMPDQPWQTVPERKPRSVHVTWTEDPSLTASIQWNIDHKGLEGYEPRLWIVPALQAEVGTEATKPLLPFGSEFVVPGACTEYREELLGAPMNEDLHVNCVVRVTGLQPATKYLYRVGTWGKYHPSSKLFEQAELSEVQQFKSAPLPGSREKFTFVAAGDSRDGTEAIAANIGPMAAKNADFWLFNGDMCELGMQPEWDRWFAAMSPALSQSPIMVVSGNHEVVISTYWAQFDLPPVPQIPEILQERAWSVDYANVHFLAIDTNTTDSILSETEWIEADLTKADADPNIDFTIVMHHHAVYSSSNHGTVERVKEELVPLYERHKVPLVFNGHDHMYERTFPVRADQVNEENGIIYVVAGAFFAPPYSAGTSWWTAVSADGDRGNYLVIEVEGSTIKGTGYYGDNIGTIDEFVIQR